jgi:hypothetical protein
MSVNQNQEFQYYNGADPLFELPSDWKIFVNEEGILSSPIINHVDKQLLKKVLKIKFTIKDKFTP